MFPFPLCTRALAEKVTSDRVNIIYSVRTLTREKLEHVDG